MRAEKDQVHERLASLKIDRSRSAGEAAGARWARWWIFAGLGLFAALGLWRFVFAGAGALEVETIRVQPRTAGGAGRQVLLEAAGYVVPHHKIEVASKVLGRVAWIGVEKGDLVRAGQPIVRLEDDEYQARFRQAEGSLAALKARLAELEAGSRPEEILRAKANLAEAKAELANARVQFERIRRLYEQEIASQQELDEAEARFEAQQARVAALEHSYELIRQGPRQEEIDAVRGQVQQAEGELAYARTQLESTVIKAPVTGTILERNVEVGEFITTSFVGDRGAKGFVVSLADLNDLQVELDISQDDFAKLHLGQKAIAATDAFPDRKYEAELVEVSPEADRQKATVQVKVQVLEPDSYLRPEMNANVAFLAAEEPEEPGGSRPPIVIPSSALTGGDSVFVLLDGRAVKRPVQVRRTTASGVEISEGLIGGEDLIVSPPPELEDGDRVIPRKT